MLVAVGLERRCCVEAETVMIDDARVVALDIEENGEPLVDVRSIGLRVVEHHPRATSTAETRFSCRQAVADRLVVADEELGDIDLVLAEGHRPLALQTLYWETTMASLRETRPELNETETANEAAKFIAPPSIVPPHSTGGAVDVILMRGDDELFMGSELNEQGEAMATDYPDLAPEYRQSRLLLVKSMHDAGFVNYGHEWWHYSYGDRYWAYATGGTAMYGAFS